MFLDAWEDSVMMEAEIGHDHSALCFTNENHCNGAEDVAHQLIGTSVCNYRKGQVYDESFFCV